MIGADGRNSLVAKAVGAAQYNTRPVLTCICYAYWRDVTPHVPAIHPRSRRVVISFPTNDGLTITPAIFSRNELPAVRTSLERHLLDALGLVGDFAEPFHRDARVERIRATGDLPNFFRQPYGDGWALVGDAGYHKDPVLAQGISDAFRSAEWLADAVHAGFSGARPLSQALAECQRVRDELFAPMYDLSCGMARLRPRPSSRSSPGGCRYCRRGVGPVEKFADLSGPAQGLFLEGGSFDSQGNLRFVAIGSGWVSYLTPDGKLNPVFNCNPPPELGQTCEPQGSRWLDGKLYLTTRHRGILVYDPQTKRAENAGLYLSQPIV